MAAAPQAAYRPFPAFSEWAALRVELRFWREALASIEKLRAETDPHFLKRAVEIVTRTAAVDTAAIEGLYEVDRGFTYSVAFQAAAWQQAFEEKGAKARSLFEGQLRAFELVLDAATKRLPISEALIRSLHEHVCAAQDMYKVLTEVGWQEHELIRGAYKRYPNNPRLADGREHAYAPPLQVKEEMERMVRELQSEAFLQADAPTQAAFAHYALVSIHPFPDGNGRVARALASVFLVRATSVPLLIYSDQKLRYLDALAAADTGNLGRFVELLRDQSLEAINLLTITVERAKVASDEQLRAEAQRLFFSREKLTHVQIDSVAERLLHEVMSLLHSIFADLRLPEEISFSTAIQGKDNRGPGEGYRRLTTTTPPVLECLIKSGAPAAAQSGATFRPLIALDPEHPRPVRVEEHSRGKYFDAGLDDLFPEISSALRFRLRTWLETLVASMVQRVIERGRKSLKDLWQA